jgi:DMSO reductase anchor subunit
MHPAPSIIFFTTASGLGYGLAAMLGLGLLDPVGLSTGVAYLLALALISAGLLSSTLHLGNPQRAWRALSQWRSSWLSREGVMAILTFVPLLICAWATLFDRTYLPVPGVIGTIFCAVTVYCTAMIYGSLKSVQAWNTRLTPICYLLFAAAGGAVLATFFALCGGGSVRPLAFAAIVLIAAAWVAKLRWRERLLTMTPLSTPESATGLGPIGSVALLERPHVTENYLTTEMGFRIARKHAAKLARIAFGLAGVVPVLLLIAVLVAGQGTSGLIASTLAAICFVAGILVERWLFFAEARHAVMNYYGQ